MSVTIICVDGRPGPERGRAVSACKDMFPHWPAVVCCPHGPMEPDRRIDWHQIPELDSLDAYSAFCINELHRHVETSHMLVVQDDGFIVRPDLWQPEWLQYDYIGAIWGDGVQGNGGFSLRSLKLMQTVRGLSPALLPGQNEDEYICRIQREFLERRGFKFAPPEVAARFSEEHHGDGQPTFGFHGYNPSEHTTNWHRCHREYQDRLKTLDEIGLEEGTDKSSKWHDYLRRYDREFSKWRDKPVHMIEMGVLTGQSMKTWTRYFQHPDSIFIALEPFEYGWTPHDPRVRWVKDFQQEPSAVMACNRCLVEATSPGPDTTFNIIIDDAGHFADPQEAALKNFWPSVRIGGVYIIEDLHAAWMPAITPEGMKKITTRLYEIVDQVHDHGLNECGATRLAAPWSDVKEVVFSKSYCLLRK